MSMIVSSRSDRYNAGSNDGSREADTYLPVRRRMMAADGEPLQLIGSNDLPASLPYDIIESAFGSNDACVASDDGQLANMTASHHEDDLVRENAKTPTILLTSGMTAWQADYPCLGPVAQTRESLRLLHQTSIFDTRPIAGAVVGSNYEIPITPPAPLVGPQNILGVLIRWGVTLGQFTPVEVGLETRGFVAFHTRTPCNRAYSLSMAGTTLAGFIFVPFAYRAAAGMRDGQSVLASIDSETTPLVSFTGLPPVVLTAFNASARCLAAFTRPTAVFGRWSGAYARLGSNNGAAR